MTAHDWRGLRVSRRSAGSRNQLARPRVASGVKPASPSRLTIWLGLIVALAVVAGYISLTAVALSWRTERDQARQALASAQAELSAKAKPVAASPSPVPTPGEASPNPSPTATVWPVMAYVVDDLVPKDTWTPAMNVTVTVKPCTQITFTATATDPLGRSLEFRFVTAGINATVLRDWGGPSYVWTAPCNVSAPVTEYLETEVEVPGIPHRLSTCYVQSPCDDALGMQYLVQD
jgi:hypothetical protein